MTYQYGVVRLGCMLGLLAHALLVASPADPALHLRSGKLSTSGPWAIAARDTLHSGLYLIQLEGPLTKLQREALETMGVRPLRYVPRDGFVARFRRVDVAALELLPFVQWVGPYRSVHKMDPRLQPGAVPGGGDLAVSVLLVRDAGPERRAEARGLFGRLEQEASTRFGTILRGQLPRGRLEALTRLNEVLWVEPTAELGLFDEVAAKIVAGDAGPGQTATMALGLDGSGVTVAVADSGLNNGDAQTMHPDLFGRVVDFFWYGNLTDASDGHGHGTHVTGIVAGNGAVGETDETGALYGLGVAPGAQVVAQRLFDDVGGYQPPPTFETLTRDATRAGAEIGSNSWGDDSNGRYDLFAAEFDALVRDADAQMPGDQPYILEFSAGNAGPGPQTIGTPAVAKNVIATGASQNNRFDFFIYADGEDAMADFSSRGPAEDGRIKPDIVAPGTWIASLQSFDATDENAWLPISDYYQYQGGTSQAGPQVSGAAAVFVQWYRQGFGGLTPSPALVKAALINSAVDMEASAGTAAIPNQDEGWGRVDLPRLVDGQRPHDFLDQTVLLESGEVYEHRLVVATEEAPLKITLTYTDVPGFPGAIPALVNDLDLEVVAPDGSLYRGNQFDAGESVPNAGGFDRLNNVEAVHLAVPLAGEYLVRVRAQQVVEDARVETPEMDQDFALVSSGDLPLPGVGLVFFNRRAYRAPDVMELRVVDRDQAGEPEVQVRVTSDTEPGGEMVLLAATSQSGTFAASLGTEAGPPAADGLLQVSHDDRLEVTYEDLSAGLTRRATARADLVAPVISGVSSTNDLGRTFVRWETDEPATSIIFYSDETQTSLQAATNLALKTSHELSLRNLAPGVTYLYLVVSADEAGNVTTNDNGGESFRFVAPTPPTLLLVDAYVPDGLFEVPPLSGYTEALDLIGVDYDVWDVTSNGDPTLQDIEPYRAVLWRPSEFGLPMGPATQSDLDAYLAGGGSLFVSSMELTTRLDENGYVDFRTNVLHVDGYLEDVMVPQIVGVAGEPSTVGVDMVSAGVLMDYSPYQDAFKEYLQIPEDISDTITPGEGAAPILLDPQGEVVGLRFPRVGEDSPGRVIYLSFPIDAVPLAGPPANNRVDLLRSLLNFLVPLEGAAVMVFDRSEYTVPSQLTVELTDLDLIGFGEVTVQFSSGSDPAARPVTLEETVRPGLFRGVVTLVSTNGGGTGTLPTAHGEVVRAEYMDLSSGRMVTAQAAVETTPPVISLVTSEAGFQDAIIRWETSEPTDALVQFGESAFLNRTAYRRSLATEHELVLGGLVPDKTYVFRVVSRDNAGNVDVDDNGGQLHAFTTLTPLTTPWADNLEGGAGDWQIVDTDGTETSWELGLPQNDYGVTAYSPQNAWASNLRGEAIGVVESFLVSPPVFIEPGTEARLRFWQNYDFPELSTDAFEFGEILVITNLAVPPVAVGYVDGATLGWEQAEINMNRYIGQLVYVVFHYVVFSFENYPRLGWLIDDVSLTVSGDAPGTIEVTNNLAQATWSLSGPLSRTGQGLFTVVSGAPAGEYTLSFGEVPFYLTPSAQGGSLAPAGLLRFEGEYRFDDVNENGMSDSWETAVFEEVSPSRTAETDTDGDGSTDQEEFIAGTDPNEPASNLILTLPRVTDTGQVELEWASVETRVYRVQGSADGETWAPVTDWMASSGPATTYTLPPPGPGQPILFRIEVRP